MMQTRSTADQPDSAPAAALRINPVWQLLTGYSVIAAFFFWMVINLNDEMATRPIMTAAAAISDGRVAAAGDIARAGEIEQHLPRALYCRADILRALGSIQLAAANDPAQRSDGLAKAENFFRQSLLCAPWQGNSWLVLAQIRQMREGHDAQTRAYIDQSYRFAPRESWIALRRVALEANADTELNGARSERFAQAVRDLAEAPDWRDLVDLYRGSTITGQQRILGALESARADVKSRFHFHVLRK